MTVPDDNVRLRGYYAFESALLLVSTFGDLL